MKQLLRILGLLLSVIFPYKLYEIISSVRSLIYTGWRMKYFSSFGEDSKLEGDNHLVGLNYVAVGNNVLIGRGTAITAFNYKEQNFPIIIIGDGCIFGQNNHITASNNIVIGEGLRTGKNVLISDNSHGNPQNMQHLFLRPDDRPLYSKGGITIGKNVWIGENVAIMAGVTIGDCVIVGANAVVTHDIPSYSIAVGVPAKCIN